MKDQHTEARNHFPWKARSPHGTLKTHETHYMFCETLGLRGTIGAARGAKGAMVPPNF